MKRAPGHGQVDRLPSGRFRARLVIEGRRVTVGIYEDEATAHRELDAAATAASAGARLDRSDSLARFGERVIARAALAGVSTAEVDGYVWRAWIVGSAIGGKPVGTITADDLRRFFDSLRAGGLRASTARAYVTAVRRVLREAHADHLLESVPSLRLPRVRRGTREPAAWTYLDPGEQERLLGGEPTAARCVVAFALYTGLRAGELVTLRLADVRPDGIVVRYGKVPDGPTKTGRVRVVPWLPAAREWWARWLAVRPAPTSPLAFPAMRGGFRLPNYTLGFNHHQESWRGLLADAGVTRRVRWHDLRHTCASSLVAGWWGRVWTLDEVRDYLGHSSIQTTERYAHLAPARLAAVAAETRPTTRPTGDGSESLAALSRNGMRPVSAPGNATFPWRGNIREASRGYGPAWGERGAAILQRLAAGDDAAIGPAFELMREVVEARREHDPFEVALERGNLALVIDALGILVRDGASVADAKGAK